MIFIRRSRGRGSVVVFILLLIGSLLEMLGVSIIVPLVQVILLPESVLKNQSWQWLWQFLRIKDGTGLVLWVSAGAVAVYIVKNAYMSFFHPTTRTIFTAKWRRKSPCGL